MNREEARLIFENWLKSNNLYRNSKSNDCPDLEFSGKILCSAKMITTGPKRSVNKPEKRRYKLVVRIPDEIELKLSKSQEELRRKNPELILQNLQTPMGHVSSNSSHEKSEIQLLPNFEDNIFLREKTFSALLNHELGTHLYRNINEGIQPWYSNRKKFGLSESCNFEMLKIEEGLAALHTTLEMPFNELFIYSILYRLFSLKVLDNHVLYYCSLMHGRFVTKKSAYMCIYLRRDHRSKQPV